MELNELKDTWHSLDERLKKQEILKENILREMLHTKSDKALNRLINFEFFGTVLTIIGIPFLIFVITHDIYHTIQRISMYLIIIYACIGLLFQFRKIYTLMKVDFSQSISTNIKLVQRFNIQIKREKIISFILIPLIALFVCAPYFSEEIELWRWIAIGAVFLAVMIIAYWQYKKIYDKNISSILNSLEELHQLEENNE